VAWIAWDHPNMPWDGTRLFVAELEIADGALPRVASGPTRVAGAPDVSIFQPSFSPDGHSIAYVTDESDWGRLAMTDLATGTTRDVGVDGSEFGTPAWLQGLRTYALLPDGARAVVTANRQGIVTISIADLRTGGAEPIPGFSEYTDAEQP